MFVSKCYWLPGHILWQLKLENLGVKSSTTWPILATSSKTWRKLKQYCDEPIDIVLNVNLTTCLCVPTVSILDQ